MTAPGLRLKMVRADLQGLPEPAPPPRKLAIRPYRPGDEAAWAALIDAAYPEIGPDPDRFATVFGADPAPIAARLGFLVTGEGDRILGTTAAWWGGHEGRDDQGRIHWVAIHPEVQGAGLSRPMVLWALHRLVALGHRDAYLMTEDFRLAAIGLYRSWGGGPAPPGWGGEQGWGGVSTATRPG